MEFSTTAIFDDETKTYKIRRIVKSTPYSEPQCIILADKILDQDYAKVLADGFAAHRDCSNLVELKSKLKIVEPDDLARNYCMETFSSTGLNNIPKFFSTSVISSWLGFQISRCNSFYDFDSITFENVIKTIRDMGNKVYSMYSTSLTSL